MNNEFNLEKALAGAKVQTRDGREVTQLVKFDVASDYVLYGTDTCNIVIETWLVDGRYLNHGKEDDSDLVMAPETLSGFIGITDDDYLLDYKSRDEALDSGMEFKAIIDLSTIKVGHGLEGDSDE